jgi:pilus assembly protein CpaE
MRGMRAGAREFFSYPFEPGVVDDAMARVVNRISLVGRERKERFVDEAAPVAKRTPGKLLVFCGAKGGAGVTTVATNFAVALAMGSTKPTALVDLNLPLGDAGLNLGLNNQYSTLDALNNINRLDTTYLAALMVRHSSGMSVLAAPGMHAQVPATRGATDKLISVAREAFDYVVVDVGSNWSWIDSEIFDQAEIIYLISQIGIPELRNSNRVITGGLAFCAEKIQVVLNRYEPKMHLLARPDIEKALTRPASWKIPSDYATVYDMQTGAKPLVQEDCQISRVIWAMAEKAGDLKLPVQPERNIFGFSKRVSRIYSVGAAK